MNNMTMRQEQRVNQAIARAAVNEYIEGDRRRSRVASTYGLGVVAALLLAGLLALIAVALSGCASGPKLDPGIVQTVARDVGWTAATAAVQYNPAYRAELLLTREALQDFVAAGSGNVTNLQAALASHLPPSFNPTNGGPGLMLGEGGVLLYDRTGALIAKIDKGQWVSTYAQPIARGLLEGINRALGMPTSQVESPPKPAFSGPNPYGATTVPLTLQTGPVLRFENGDRGPLYYRVEASEDLRGWRQVGEGVALPGTARVVLPGGAPREFYRVAWPEG